MPGIANRGQKRPSTVLSDDEEVSDASSGPSSASKRARRDHTDTLYKVTHTSPARAERWPHSQVVKDQTNGDTGRRETSNTEIEGDEDAVAYDTLVYQPGAIVRVTLNNFVTYTAAEFHPGPSLNMVIGPNGNGKSTLVCAICLGLGWDPKVSIISPARGSG